MSETLTDEHHDWVASVLKVDPRSYEPEPAAQAAAPAAAAQPEAAAGAGDDASGGGFFDKISEGLGKVASAVSDTVATVKSGVETAIDKVETAVVEEAKTIGKAVEAVGEKVAETAGKIAKSVEEVFTGPPPVKPGEAGPAQTKRADKLLEKMPPEDQEKVQKLLDAAPEQEKGYLKKAIASKHSAAEIEEFQKAISGKDEAWLQENLHLVGQSEGKGIKQQWHDSCGPTTIQAMKGELDPIYALKMRTENPDFEDVDVTDATKLNPKMAEEQKNILVGKGGVARNRDSHGQGIPLTDALNDQKASTGLKFKIEEVDASTVDDRLQEMDKSVNSGLPVPMRVSDAGNSGGHFVLVVGVEEGPPRTFSIHDPWDGKIVKVTDKQIKENDFNIANWNKVSHIYKPSADSSADAGP